VEAGVAHVCNPDEPFEPPVVYELRERWRLSSEDADGELVFGTIDAAARDGGGNLYLLDAVLETVHVISPAGEYRRSVGRAGEGPGEFDDPTDLSVSSDGRVRVVDTRGVVRFDAQGNPTGVWEPQLPEYAWFGLLHACPAGLGTIVSLKARAQVENASHMECLVARCSADGKIETRLAERSWIYKRYEPFVFDEEAMEAYSFLAFADDGSLYLAPTFSAYTVQVFTPEGRLRMVIERAYEPVRRKPADLADLHSHWGNVYRRVQQLEIRISENERNITALYPRSDGSLWVETSRGWDNLPSGVADILDVFDAEGRFVRQAILRKDIDTANDLLFIIGEQVLIATAGYAARMTAGGTSSQNLREMDRSDALPAAILCDLIRQP
jgi:hypothetical protein